MAGLEDSAFITVFFLPRRRDFSSSTTSDSIGLDLSRDRLLARRADFSLCSEVVRLVNSMVEAGDCSLDLLLMRCSNSLCSGVALVADVFLAFIGVGSVSLMEAVLSFG